MTPINIDDRAPINEQRKQDIMESRVQFSEHVIPFRDDRMLKTPRTSWRVHVGLLRLRKNNSRIKNCRFR